MSSCIYSLKMLLLQEQLGKKPEYLEKLRRLSEFVAVCYSSHWFQSPLAAEAACNDFQFCKKMLECQTISKLKQVADTAIQTLNRHLWCLTEELVQFALCSKQLTPELKEILGRKLWKLYRENQNKVFAPQKPLFLTISVRTEIPDLAGERSVLLFQHFNLSIDDLQSLSYALNRWPLFEGYNKLEKFVLRIKITNDTAERGIKLLEDFKDVLTEDSEQRNIVMHCVENIEKDFLMSRNKLFVLEKLTLHITGLTALFD